MGMEVAIHADRVEEEIVHYPPRRGRHEAFVVRKLRFIREGEIVGKLDVFGDDEESLIPSEIPHTNATTE